MVIYAEGRRGWAEGKRAEPAKQQNNKAKQSKAKKEAIGSPLLGLERHTGDAGTDMELLCAFSLEREGGSEVPTTAAGGGRRIGRVLDGLESRRGGAGQVDGVEEGRDWFGGLEVRFGGGSGSTRGGTRGGTRGRGDLLLLESIDLACDLDGLGWARCAGELLSRSGLGSRSRSGHCNRTASEQAKRSEGKGKGKRSGLHDDDDDDDVGRTGRTAVDFPRSGDGQGRLLRVRGPFSSRTVSYHLMYLHGSGMSFVV